MLVILVIVSIKSHDLSNSNSYSNLILQLFKKKKKKEENTIVSSIHITSRNKGTRKLGFSLNDPTFIVVPFLTRTAKKL